MAPPKLQKMLEPLEKALEQCSAEEQAIHKELQSLLPGQPQKQKPHIEVGRGAAEDAGQAKASVAVRAANQI